MKKILPICNIIILSFACFINLKEINNLCLVNVMRVGKTFQVTILKGMTKMGCLSISVPIADM